MKKVNHPLHIVLAVLTGGLWLIPYAVILWNAGRRRPAPRPSPQQRQQYDEYQAWCTAQARDIKARNS